MTQIIDRWKSSFNILEEFIKEFCDEQLSFAGGSVVATSTGSGVRPNKKLLWPKNKKRKKPLEECGCSSSNKISIYSEKKLSPETKEVIKDFIRFVQAGLKIKEFPKIYLHLTKKPDMTTGSYKLDDNSIHCLVGHRLTLDVLRSLAHELTHRKQHESGSLEDELAKIDPMDEMGDINTPHENEAYTKAGNMVKVWARKQNILPKEKLYQLYEQLNKQTPFKGSISLSEQNQTLKATIPLPDDLKRLSGHFKRSGRHLYLVGGAVRDFLMGKTPKDYDLVSDAPIEEIERILSLDPNLKILELGKAFGVIKVITPKGNEFEIAQPRIDIGKGRRPEDVAYTTIEQDSQRRDLSVNALYYDIEKQEIIDYVGGISDIEKGIIRTVGKPEERFEEDALRKLRIIRFSARIGSGIDKATSEALKKDNSLQGVSPERIRDEFLKGIKNAKSISHFLGLVSEYDFWSQVFPGLVINHDYKESHNIPVILALLLTNNLPDNIGKRLNALKYSSDEVKQVTFLVLFQGLSENNAPKLKKFFKNSKLSKNDLIEFAKLSNNPNMRLAQAFNEYDLSVSGEELLKLGFKDKDLGRELERREIESFKNKL